MSLGIAILLIIAAVFVLKTILSLSLRIIGFTILIGITALTIWICTVQPEMHKPFSLSTIEYLLKINKDGSVTTTKQVTQTVLKQDGRN